MEPCITAGTGIEETGFGCKYKMIILYWLAEYSVLRYNELKRRLGTISHKTLSLSLKELEADGPYSFDDEETERVCHRMEQEECSR